MFVNPLRDPNDRRLPRVAGPCSLVLFGVTGDLAKKKLLPAIYDLANRGLLPPGFGLVGFGRREWSHQQFVAYLEEQVRANRRTEFSREVFDQLAEGVRFVSGSFTDDAAYRGLKAVLDELDNTQGTRGNHAFYLSVPPNAFDPVVSKLATHGLADETSGFSRVVIEKPFGHDLASAQELERTVASVFGPQSVFRIDHYLGKETVQNMMALRFANQLFEPIWNRSYIDHVQITMAEDIGIGSRAGYYDGIGAARDVIQNHLLQLLALVAMEEPTSFEASQLRAEKEKVLAAVTLPKDVLTHSVRAQYAGGWAGGELVAGYLDEDGVAAGSTTETYAALRVNVENRRWAGVPFYLRTAKRMPRRVTEVALQMRPAPHLPFSGTDVKALGRNAIVLRIQPNEGIHLRFAAKVPGPGMELREVGMDFAYGGAFSESSPEAYERLILDVLLGDPPLFPHHREVELSWMILDPVLQAWQELGGPLPQYQPGSWGPTDADTMLARDGFAWRRP